MKRVFISGAHGSGKTTLGKALAEKLGWEYKGEAARSVIEKLGNPKDMDFQDQLSFQEAVFKAQKKVQGGGYIFDDAEDIGGVIIDRSMLDVAAYLEMFYEDGQPCFKDEPETFKQYASLRMKILDSFYLGSEDVLVVLPPLESVEDDGVRFTGNMARFHQLLMRDFWRMADLQSDFHKRVLRIEEPASKETYLQKVVDSLLYR